MTESKDNSELNEQMDPRFQNLAAYALNVLDTEEERRAVEALIDQDAEALAELIELTESTELLANSVPQIDAPPHLKASILKLAEADSAPNDAPVSLPSPSGPAWWTRIFQSGYAVSAAAAVLVIVVAGSLGYQNNQLGNEVDSLRAEVAAEAQLVAQLQSDLSTTLNDSETRVASMKSEMEVMEDEFGSTVQMLNHQEEMVSKLAVANDALQQALLEQSRFTYLAMQDGYELASWLGNSQQVSTPGPGAAGLMAVRYVGNEAVFQVHGLEQPLDGYTYTLWLMGYGDPRPVAQFGVSEIGSATIAFLLPAPLQYFSSVLVTQERVDGLGSDPSGTMVLTTDSN